MRARKSRPVMDRMRPMMLPSMSPLVSTCQGLTMTEPGTRPKKERRWGRRGGKMS